MMTYSDLGGDATGQRIGDIIWAAYAEAGQPNNSGGYIWAGRTWYDATAGGLTVDQSIHKHLLSDTPGEMRSALGLAAAPPPQPDVDPNASPAPIAPRDYAGNMCGVRVPYLSPVDGGARDPSLVLSWFYMRYTADQRASIRAAWKARGYLDVLLSWPDDRAIGLTPDGFVAECQELIADGFRPCVMLLSKVYDPNYDMGGCQARINGILPQLIAADCVSRYCLGWELSLWLSPKDVQDLIDTYTKTIIGAGRPFYVHFQQGYFAFSQEHYNPDTGAMESVTADFWNLNVGKLTGVWHQRDLSWATHQDYQDRIVDCLERFAGNFGFSPDSGFGHPFDFIALEITAAPQFDGSCSESQGDDWGRCAITTPPCHGPLGEVRVMGSGNGA